jgi:dihydrofolate reductase
MRKLILSEFLTLDGVMEAPEKWVFPFQGKAIETFKLRKMREADALLLGRVTYSIFATSWPSMTGELADRMNGVCKHIVSPATDQLAWTNSQRVDGDAGEAVSRLKQQPGQDIVLVGSRLLAQMLMQTDLIDEYRLLVYPLVLGKGKRLFAHDIAATLKHLDTQSLDNGVVLLRYVPARADG